MENKKNNTINNEVEETSENVSEEIINKDNNTENLTSTSNSGKEGKQSQEINSATDVQNPSKDGSADLSDKDEESDDNEYFFEQIKDKFKKIHEKYSNKIDNLNVSLDSLKEELINKETENNKLVRQIITFRASHEKLLNLAERQEYLKRYTKKIETNLKYATSNIAKDLLDPIEWLEHIVDNYKKEHNFLKKEKEVEEGPAIIQEAKDKAEKEIEKTPEMLEAEERNRKDLAWIKGIELILTKFLTILESNKIIKIVAEIGSVFDPQVHEVIDVIPSEEYKVNQIIEVVRSGYKLHDRVIRHAQVKVVK